MARERTLSRWKCDSFDDKRSRLLRLLYHQLNNHSSSLSCELVASNDKNLIYKLDIDELSNFCTHIIPLQRLLLAEIQYFSRIYIGDVMGLEEVNLQLVFHRRNSGLSDY